LRQVRGAVALFPGASPADIPRETFHGGPAISRFGKPHWWANAFLFFRDRSTSFPPWEIFFPGGFHNVKTQGTPLRRLSTPPDRGSPRRKRFVCAGAWGVPPVLGRGHFFSLIPGLKTASERFHHTAQNTPVRAETPLGSNLGPRAVPVIFPVLSGHVSFFLNTPRIIPKRVHKLLRARFPMVPRCKAARKCYCTRGTDGAGTGCPSP